MVLDNFGLPSDLDEVAESEEFRLDEMPRYRSLAVLPVAVPEDRFFPAGGGASLHFPSEIAPRGDACVVGKPSNDKQRAPHLGPYYKLSRSHYPVAQPLKTVRADIMNAFAEMSVNVVGEEKCAFECEAYHNNGILDFEVKIFSTEHGHLVEFLLLNGCRFGWRSFLSSAQDYLRLSPSGSLAPCTPSLLVPPPPPVGLVMPLSSAGACPLAGMMSERSVEGCRGACRMSSSPATVPQPLLETVEGLVDGEDDDVATLAAFTIIANMAENKTASTSWLKERLDALKGAFGSDNPHIRREATRALAAMSTQRELAIGIVRAGIIPDLELEASGGSDRPLQAWATCALVSCRA